MRAPKWKHEVDCSWLFGARCRLKVYRPFPDGMWWVAVFINGIEHHEYLMSAKMPRADVLRHARLLFNTLEDATQ